MTTLTIHCAHCHGIVELRFAEWTESCRAAVRRWTCPHCEQENAGALPGRIALVTKAAEEKARD